MISARIDRLGEFPFRRLAGLCTAGTAPAGLEVVDLSIGEPKHPPPALLAETVARNAHLWNRYPPPAGTPEFRRTVTAWLTRRYALPDGFVEPDRHVLPLAGTKEGLFLLPQLLAAESGRRDTPAVLMPNPVYSVYYGAALMAGAEPVALPAEAATGFLPDLDALTPDLLQRTVLFYLCSPANPQGAAADEAYLARVLALAREHRFVLALDECYSELWYEKPPTGGMEVAARSGSLDHLLVFHSLSKRSNAAGLRAGFVAGDPALLAGFARLRAFAAAVQPMPLMAAAMALWGEEAHVEANRAAYRTKLDMAQGRLGNRFGFYRPDGGFFLWLDVGDGEAVARELWRRSAIKVLPGAYLSLPGATGVDPGAPYIRAALTAEPQEFEAALDRFAGALDRLGGHG